MQWWCISQGLCFTFNEKFPSFRATGDLLYGTAWCLDSTKVHNRKSLMKICLALSLPTKPHNHSNFIICIDERWDIHHLYEKINSKLWAVNKEKSFNWIYTIKKKSSHKNMLTNFLVAVQNKNYDSIMSKTTFTIHHRNKLFMIFKKKVLVVVIHWKTFNSQRGGGGTRSENYSWLQMFNNFKQEREVG